jgi:hypothetical protein
MLCDAKKCVRCGAYQDWRGGYFSQSTALILTLLVALVSVMTAAGPFLKWLFTPQQATLECSVFRVEPDVPSAGFTLIVSNVGAIDGVVRDVTLIIEGAAASQARPLLKITSKDPLIHPSESKLVEVSSTFTDGTTPQSLPRRAGTGPCMYILDLEVVDRGHRRYYLAGDLQPHISHAVGRTECR